MSMHTHTHVEILFVCKKLWNKIESSVFKCYAFIHAVLAQMLLVFNQRMYFCFILMSKATFAL